MLHKKPLQKFHTREKEDRSVFWLAQQYFDISVIDTLSYKAKGKRTGSGESLLFILAILDRIEPNLARLRPFTAHDLSITASEMSE